MTICQFFGAATDIFELSGCHVVVTPVRYSSITKWCIRAATAQCYRLMLTIQWKYHTPKWSTQLQASWVRPSATLTITWHRYRMYRCSMHGDVPAAAFVAPVVASGRKSLHPAADRMPACGKGLPPPARSDYIDSRALSHALYASSSFLLRHGSGPLMLKYRPARPTTPNMMYRKMSTRYSHDRPFRFSSCEHTYRIC